MVEGFEEFKEKGGAAMAYQYFTNVPQSIRIETAKKIQEGESMGEYANRVKLAYENKKRFEREMKGVILKYMYSEADGDMTRFNRAYEVAKEWKKLKDAGEETERYKELKAKNKNNVLGRLYDLTNKKGNDYRKFIKKGNDVRREDLAAHYKYIKSLVDEVNRE